MAADKKTPSFLSHAATYAIGNIARRLVGFVMLPIYTRYLSPADYGVVALLAFAMAVFEPLFGARLGRAIPKFYFDATDERSRRAVIWGALCLTFLVSAITMVALVAFRGSGSEILFGNRKYAVALGLYAVNLVSQPVEDNGMTYIRLRERSRLFLAISMAKLLMQVALNVLLVVTWREGVVGIVLSGIISSVAFGAALTLYVASQEAPAFDWKVTNRMLQFCWPLWLSGIAGLYIGSSGAMYLRVFDSLNSVGLLELAQKFSSVVSILVWAPFFQHWEPMSFRYYKEESGRQNFQVAFIAISALMFVVGLGISIFSEPVINVIASKPFHAASTIVPILTFGVILNVLMSFFRFSFLITESTKVHGVYQYMTAGMITIAYLLLVPRFGLVGAAAAQSITFAVSFIYTYFGSKKYYDAGYNLIPFGAFAVVCSVTYLLSNVLLRMSNVTADLLSKSLFQLAATALILFIAIRAIWSVNPAVLDNLPLPLRRRR